VNKYDFGHELQAQAGDIFPTREPIFRSQDHPEWAVSLGIILPEFQISVARGVLKALAGYKPGKFNFRLKHALFALMNITKILQPRDNMFPVEINFLNRNPTQSNKKFPDVWLVAGEKKIPVHRHMLASGSEFFNALFGTTMAESGKSDFPIGDVEPEILELVVQSCYSNQISIATPEYSNFSRSRNVFKCRSFRNFV
jgi:hypothetical protein